MSELTIVVPTYNERENIGRLIAQLGTALDGIAYEIVVVDDQSPDGTGDVVEQLRAAGQPVRLITKNTKEGIGAALRVGYEACFSPLIASTDADLSFDPADLRRLYAALKGGLDFVVGTRHSAGSFYETPNWTIRTKYLVSSLGNTMLRLVTGIPVDDFTGNFRMFSTATWRAIETREKTNILLFEMILKAYVGGYRVGQVPVAFHDRRFGSSKLRLSLEIPKFFWRLLGYMYTYWQPLAKRRFGSGRSV